MRIPHNEPLASGILEAHPAGSDQPERRCILTGRHGGRDELIRLAISPDGDVLPDVLARAPGRGAWIGVSRAELVAPVIPHGVTGAPDSELALNSERLAAAVGIWMHMVLCGGLLGWAHPQVLRRGQWIQWRDHSIRRKRRTKGCPFAIAHAMQGVFGRNANSLAKQGQLMGQPLSQCHVRVVQASGVSASELALPANAACANTSADSL